MDTSVQSIGSVSGIISVLSICAYGIYKCCQHFHCGSKCCGTETSLDVDLGEHLTKDESVYLKVKNRLIRHLPPLSSSSSPAKAFSPPQPPPPSPTSLSQLTSLEQLEHSVRF